MIGVLNSKIVLCDLDLSCINKTDISYEIEINHRARQTKEFDLAISRFAGNKITHSIPIYLAIANPSYIYSKIDDFRRKPHYYFFNITNLFSRQDMNDEDIIKFFPNGIPLLDHMDNTISYIKL
jgi:hypothetical protein